MTMHRFNYKPNKHNTPWSETDTHTGSALFKGIWSLLSENHS